jgi:hypothetical protein
MYFVFILYTLKYEVFISYYYLTRHSTIYTGLHKTVFCSSLYLFCLFNAYHQLSFPMQSPNNNNNNNNYNNKNNNNNTSNRNQGGGYTNCILNSVSHPLKMKAYCWLFVVIHLAVKAYLWLSVTIFVFIDGIYSRNYTLP